VATPARPCLPACPPAAVATLQVPASNLQLPFFVGHGSVDQLIPPVIATTTQDVLEGLGCTKVEFHM
jgi:predicted esterase